MSAHEATGASADTCKSVCHWLSRHFEGRAVCCLAQGARARGRRRRTKRAQRALRGRGRRGRRLAPTGARRRATGRGRRRRGCVASGHNHRGLLAVCAGSCCLRGGFSGCRCCATAARAPCGGVRKHLLRHDGHAATSLRLPAHWLRAGAALWGGAARGTGDGLPPPPTSPAPLGSAQLNLRDNEIGAAGAAELAKALATNDTLTAVCMVSHSACVNEWAWQDER